MSRKVLITQYGTDEIVIKNHDPIFDLLTGSRIRNSKQQMMARAETGTVTFYVREDIAQEIQRYAQQIYGRLFRAHINMMRWYVAAQVRALGRGHAKAAVLDWLYIHGVDEDDFGSEAAYKSFQRFGWDFDEKNKDFSGQLRRKSSPQLSQKIKWCAKKREPLQPLVLRMEDVTVELAIARFLTQYNNTFRRLPVKLPKHAKVYLYIQMQRLSIRDAEKKLQMNKSSVEYIMASMRKRMDRNPTVRILIEQCVDLPALV